MEVDQKTGSCHPHVSSNREPAPEQWAQRRAHPSHGAVFLPSKVFSAVYWQIRKMLMRLKFSCDIINNLYFLKLFNLLMNIFQCVIRKPAFLFQGNFGSYCRALEGEGGPKPGGGDWVRRKGWLVNHRKTTDLERQQGQDCLVPVDRRTVTSMGILGKPVT